MLPKKHPLIVPYNAFASAIVLLIPHIGALTVPPSPARSLFRCNADRTLHQRLGSIASACTYSSSYDKNGLLARKQGPFGSTVDDEIDFDISSYRYDALSEKEATSDKQSTGDPERSGQSTHHSALEAVGDEMNAIASETSSHADKLASTSYLRYDEDASEMELIMDKVLLFAPFFMPLIAYSMYDPTAIAFAATIEFLTTNNWVAVDGGAYQAMIIAPVINGIVVPCKLNVCDHHRTTKNREKYPQFHLPFDMKLWR